MHHPLPDPDRPSRAACRQIVRGLYGIADAEASGGDPVQLARSLVESGCRVVQLRCKGWGPDETRRAALEVRRITAEAGAAFVVNDDPVLARDVGADGLHLGQLDGSLNHAREEAPGLWIGRSTHTPDQALQAVAEGADYVAFGPIWGTPHLSRPKAVRGVERLVAIRALVPAAVPLVAIGGITAERLDALRSAGADAWAVIGAVAHAADPVAAARLLI